MKNRLRFQLPAIVLVRIVLNIMLRMVYPFLPIFSRELGVSLWQISQSIALRSAAGMLGPLLASVADTRGRKTGMLIGLLLFSVGAGIQALFPTYPVFTLALILTLLGNLMFVPAMQAYLGDRVPYRRRGLVLAFTEFGWSLSFIIGIPWMGWVIASRGWLAPFPILTGLSLGAILLLAWLLPGEQTSTRRPAGLVSNLSAIWHCSPALAGLIMGLTMSMANELINLVFGVWMEANFGLQIAALGAASAVIGASELMGETLVSGLTDRLGKSRAVTIGLIGNSVAALCLLFIGWNLAGALLGLFLIYLTFEFSLVSAIPLMTEVLPGARATLMAVYIACLSLGRALGGLIALPLYQLERVFPALPGILIIGVISACFNLAALYALRQVHPASQVLTQQAG